MGQRIPAMTHHQRFYLNGAFALAAICLSLPTAAAQPAPDRPPHLNRNVLDILPQAARLPENPAAAGELLTLTLTLNWSDPAGFEAFGQAFDDPASPDYRRVIGVDELSSRFSPTQAGYDAVMVYLEAQGFTLVQGSPDRLTITVTGTRAQAESAFAVHIGDYQIGNRRFHAIDSEPVLPAGLDTIVGSISGLSNLARPRMNASPSPATSASIAAAYNSAGLPPGINGAGQTIGLVEFDSYVASDVSNWLATVGLPASLINQVTISYVASTVAASGCAPGSGCGTTEVLLDIAAALDMAQASRVVVYIASASTDMITAVTAALNGVRTASGGSGGTVSLSWSACEKETTNATMDSMESLLKGYSYTGTTLFASTGDNGSTCVAPGSMI